MKRVLFLSACVVVLLGSVASLIQAIGPSAIAGSQPAASQAASDAVRALGIVRLEQARQRDAIASLNAEFARTRTSLDEIRHEIADRNRQQIAALSAKIDELRTTQATLLEARAELHKRLAGLEHAAARDDHDLVARTDDSGNGGDSARSTDGSLPVTEDAAASADPSPDRTDRLALAPPFPSGLKPSDGVFEYNKGNYANAYGIWKQLAEKGNARAQYFLGAILYEGKGVPKNLAEARHWLSMASDNGISRADAILREVNQQLSQVKYPASLSSG